MPTASRAPQFPARLGSIRISRQKEGAIRGIAPFRIGVRTRAVAV